MSRALLLSTLVLAALSLASCSRKEPAPREVCPELDAGKPVDPALFAFLSRARAAHHTADLHEQDKDLQGAVRALESLLSGPIPSADRPPPEVREVLADTRARLADYRSQLGDFDAAARDVGQGLELAREPSYFRGHLFEVRGLIEERRARKLRDAGDAPSSEQAKQRALEAFEESMRIQEQVIRDSLPREERR